MRSVDQKFPIHIDTASWKTVVATFLVVLFLLSLSGCSAAVPLSEACVEDESAGKPITIEGYISVGEQSCWDYGESISCDVFVEDGQDHLRVRYATEPNAVINPFDAPSILPVTWFKEQVCDADADCLNEFDTTRFRVKGACALVRQPGLLVGGVSSALIVSDLGDFRPAP
jgi:hypothetical protein